MTLGITSTDWNTARYIQSVQAMDGLSNGALNSMFNTSIFGNNGFGYSSVPFAGYGMNFDQMMNYQQQYTDANLALQKKNKAANLLSTANDNSISRQIASLQRQVQGNKQENIMQEYNKLVAAVRQTYEEAGYIDISDAQIKATAERMYADATGNALIDDIKAHSDNSFVHGFKKVASFGLAGGTNRDQNIENISGENTNNNASKAGTIAGGIAGGAVAAAEIGFAATTLKGIQIFLKSDAAKRMGKALVSFFTK